MASSISAKPGASSTPTKPGWSTRGSFKFNNNHYPIEDFYLTKVAKRPDGRFQTEIAKKVFSDYSDPFAKDCPMK